MVTSLEECSDVAKEGLRPSAGQREGSHEGGAGHRPGSAGRAVRGYSAGAPAYRLPSMAEMSERARGQQPPLTHEEYEARYGANPEDLAKVEAFASEHGLKVVESSIPRRLVILSGTVAQFSEAFGVHLDHCEYPQGTYRGRTGPVHIPADLQQIIVGVFGLDNRPIAKPHLRRLPRDAPQVAQAVTFDPPQVAQLYNFPTDVDGTGQCIGIIELGGGFLHSDLRAFFGNLNLNVPTVNVVPVDGGRNNFNDSEADGEVALDIQVAGAVAPGATIAVYFAPNDPSSKGFLDALTQAVHDRQNNPSVISISWGGPDEDPTDNFLQQFHEALQAAMMFHITVCTAAGDNGAADETPRDRLGRRNWDGQAHVDFPSSSPFALACGGTRLIGANGTIASETVWNQGRASFDDSTRHPRAGRSRHLRCRRPRDRVQHRRQWTAGGGGWNQRRRSLVRGANRPDQRETETPRRLHPSQDLCHPVGFACLPRHHRGE